jgi:dUTP pyrophosphatase
MSLWFARFLANIRWIVQQLRGEPELRMVPVGAVRVPVPARAYPDDVGLDLRAAIPEPITLAAHGGRATVPTGWAVEVPPGYEGQVRPRSGHSRRGIVVVLGTIDNYRGELHVTVENHAAEPLTIEPEERIAQLVVAPVARPRPVVVDRLTSSARGANGLGSSGRT